MWATFSDFHVSRSYARFLLADNFLPRIFFYLFYTVYCCCKCALGCNGWLKSKRSRFVITLSSVDNFQKSHWHVSKLIESDHHMYNASLHYITKQNSFNMHKVGPMSASVACSLHRPLLRLWVAGIVHCVGLGISVRCKFICAGDTMLAISITIRHQQALLSSMVHHAVFQCACHACVSRYAEAV